MRKRKSVRRRKKKRKREGEKEKILIKKRTHLYCWPNVEDFSLQIKYRVRKIAQSQLQKYVATEGKIGLKELRRLSQNI
jgi:hypothetical protein